MIRKPTVAALALACAVILLGLSQALAQAPPPLHLREGEAMVPDQSEQARQTALREALAQVLVRMAGDSTIAEDPLIRRRLESAPQLLQHFRYRQELVTPEDAPPRAQLYLVARFQDQGVDRILDDAGARLWLSPRPTTLLLVEIDEEDSRSLVGEGQADRLAEFQRRARLRALPWVLPLLDLEEQIRLTPQALGAGLRDVLEDMGQRYGAPAVLHGRLTRLADVWVASWTLRVEGEFERWESVGHYDTVLASAAEGLGDALGRRYALSAAERLGGVYRLAVAGIDAPTDYPRLLRLLSGNALVREVMPERVSGDGAVLRVQAAATLERLLQSLTLGYALAPDPAAAAEPGVDAHLLLLP